MIDNSNVDDVKLNDVTYPEIIGYFNDDDDDDEDSSLIGSSIKRKWNVFRVIPPARTHASQSSKKLLDRSVKFVKILAYLFTFTVVLAGGILAKALLLLMTSQLNPTKTDACVSDTLTSTFSPSDEERILWTWVIFGIFCVPELATIIRTGRICLFNFNKWPRFRHWLVVMTIETLHVIGVAMLVFEVLPNLDAVRGVMLTNAVCLVPAILKLWSRDQTQKVHAAMLVADWLAVLMQISALLVWPLTSQSTRQWILVPALIFTSCGWWMNFVPKEIPKKGNSSECLEDSFVESLPNPGTQDEITEPESNSSPKGLEVRMTETGLLYFVDHNTRSTFLPDSQVDPNLIFRSPTKPLETCTEEQLGESGNDGLTEDEIVAAPSQRQRQSCTKLVANFRSLVTKRCTGFIRLLCKTKKGVNDRAVYHRTYLLIASWKIIIFFFSMLAILAVQGQDLYAFFSKTEAAFGVHVFNGTRVRMLSPHNLSTSEQELVAFESSEYGWLWISLVQAFAAWSCYIFSKFACKVRIQRISMSLATILVVPGAIVLLVAMDTYQKEDLCIYSKFLPPYMFWNMDISSSFISDKVAWIWLFWMLSQIWITLHIWFPKCERLAKTEKLFATPMYSSILIDQSICLNRKVDEKTLSPKNVEADDENEDIPHVIACATMWHETKYEMLTLLKSIVHMDLDQCIRRIVRDTKKIHSVSEESNYYTFDCHIFIDDAFEMDWDSNNFGINSFVRDLIDVIPRAVQEVHRSYRMKVEKPEIFPTPYGGRLVYTLPGKTVLTVHLKNKCKVRHRKRWSQCMYMYYLLGYQIMCRDDVSIDRKCKMAQNTFILALDGDIDFHTESVLLLVDLMRRNENVGAACGRVHPVGSGLISWYQAFEYAVGHWLQKSTEHMTGCVLCSPGCFSLFRAQALMDDNVLAMYARNSEAAMDYIQFDQGEDRWLCTLLLQRGYRIEYSAASDAYTHCPESFEEFYHQRRRWYPSTMANIMDLISNYKRTIELNSDISSLYILYQVMLMVATILGPGTVFLVLVDACAVVFEMTLTTSFFLNLIPILIYIIVCFTTGRSFQIKVATVFSLFYSLLMMSVLVGILIEIEENGFLTPSTLFALIVAAEMLITAFLHPRDLYSLPFAAIYYVCIPSMHLLLVIFAVCNLHIVTWGTREYPRKFEPEPEGRKTRGNFLKFFENFAPKSRKSKGWFADFLRCLFCSSADEEEEENRILECMMGVNKRLDTIERNVDAICNTPLTRRIATSSINPKLPSARSSVVGDSLHGSVENISITNDDLMNERDDLLNPRWMDDSIFGKAKRQFLSTDESNFWTELVLTHLRPIDWNADRQRVITSELKELRTQSSVSFFMLNALYITFVFLLQLHKDKIFINWPLGVKSNITYDEATFEVIIKRKYIPLEPMAVVFASLFSIILIVQFFGMLLHRFETLCHLISTTDLITSDDARYYSMDYFVENAKIGVRKLNEKNKLDDDDDDEDTDRKTVEKLDEPEMGPINLDEQVTKYLVIEEQRRIDEQEKSDRSRRSSNSSNLFMRRKSGTSIPLRPLSVYSRTASVCNDTIVEEAEEAC